MREGEEMRGDERRRCEKEMRRREKEMREADEEMREDERRR